MFGRYEVIGFEFQETHEGFMFVSNVLEMIRELGVEKVKEVVEVCTYYNKNLAHTLYV